MLCATPKQCVYYLLLSCYRSRNGFCAYIYLDANSPQAIISADAAKKIVIIKLNNTPNQYQAGISDRGQSSALPLYTPVLRAL